MANLSTTGSTAAHTLAGRGGITPAFPRRRPETRALLSLALEDDEATATMAIMELRSRLDHLHATEQEVPA